MDDSNDSTIHFNKEGICNYCTEAMESYKTVYFPNSEGQSKISALISALKREGKGKQYDCLMGISGGLDSTYLAYLGHKWGLRILGIHIDDGFDTEIAQNNIRKLCNACGIDLKIVKPDAEQFNDLTRAYFLAEVPNVAAPQDNILFAYLYHYAKKYKVHSFLSGGNFALECILKQDKNPVNVYDMSNIRDIHKQYGRKPIDKLLFLSNYKRVIDRYIYGIKSIRPLNYIDYNKKRALKELKEFCDYDYYEMKHCENYLTKIIQLYWLVEKFNVDKRTSHLSSMIVSGQMTREDALEELSLPVYNKSSMDKDIDFVISKLDISRQEFDNLINQPGKSHTDYKTSMLYRVIRKNFKKVLIKYKG